MKKSRVLKEYTCGYCGKCFKYYDREAEKRMARGITGQIFCSKACSNKARNDRFWETNGKRGRQLELWPKEEESHDIREDWSGWEESEESVASVDSTPSSLYDQRRVAG